MCFHDLVVVKIGLHNQDQTINVFFPSYRIVFQSLYNVKRIRKLSVQPVHNPKIAKVLVIFARIEQQHIVADTVDE